MLTFSDQGRIDSLVASPSEGLNVEIKRWFDPEAPAGTAKIVKALHALRNRNGGYLVIGIENDSLKPDHANRPADVRLAFHIDKIQAAVSRYSSTPFEVSIGFALRDGLEYPVIIVPEGVTTPVAIKRDLIDRATTILQEGDVFFRTLRSNGTPSTSKARAEDWATILEICFENREADIGRFFRRNLTSDHIASLASLLTGRVEIEKPPALRELTESLLAAGDELWRNALAARQMSNEERRFLNGATWGVALVVEPQNKGAAANQDFLRTFFSANPRYTGWPVWLDSRSFDDESARPKIVDRGWQALIVSVKTDWSPHIDFLRLEPVGRFYMRRLLQDDTSPQKVEPYTALDPILVVIRVAEAIAVGLSVTKALGWSSDAQLGFGFEWDHLAGRRLDRWANPVLNIGSGQTIEDKVASYVAVSADTPVAAIAPFVQGATRDLFLSFDGYELPYNVIEDWVKRLIERRLGGW